MKKYLQEACNDVLEMLRKKANADKGSQVMDFTSEVQLNNQQKRDRIEEILQEYREAKEIRMAEDDYLEQFGNDAWGEG